MENTIFDFKSYVGDVLKVYEDRIVIIHSGALNLLTRGRTGDKTIYYSDLTAIEFQKAVWIASGHIQFSLPSGYEKVSSNLDENTIYINSSENEIAEKIVAYIQEKIKESRQPKTTTASISAADEVMKLKNLLDIGVINQEEFEIKKKQLLGL